MKQNFDRAFNLIIDIETGGDPEGGYTNNPVDPGGETKWGISKRANHEVDVKNLTKDQAAIIYKTKYWNPISGDTLPFPLDVVTFDTAVHHGVSTAGRLLFTSRQVIPNGDGNALSQHLLAQRLAKYALDPNWRTFGAGWTNRISKVLKAISLP